MKLLRSLHHISSWAMLVCLIATLTALYLPVGVMVAESLKDSATGDLTLQWYRALSHETSLYQSLERSIWVALVSSIASTALGFLAALSFADSPRWLKYTIKVESSIALALPELVFALSLLILLSKLQVQLSLWSVILGHITLCLPFTTLIAVSRVSTLNPELEHAARDLGASEYQILSRIKLPILKTAIFSSMALAYLISFDDFLITYFVNGAGQDTLPVKLYTNMKAGQSPTLHALAVIMLLATTTLAIPLIYFFSKNKKIDLR
jgi:spermidine/putrescine transport system permease protein